MRVWARRWKQRERGAGNSEMSQSTTSYFSPWGCNQSGPGNVNSFK